MVWPLSATHRGLISGEASLRLPEPPFSRKCPLLTFALNLTFNEKQTLVSAIVLEPSLPTVRFVGFIFMCVIGKFPGGTGEKH